MDLPQPPADQELKNIIDKLAQFVARNGPEFEHMTKQKQKDNPKFSFLFGGTYFHYYQYRVTTEQAILKQKQRLEQQQAIVQQAINRQSIQTAPWQQHLHQIQDTSQDQIRQSEQNLAAQHQLLLTQQQVQVDEVIRKAQEEKLTKLAKENDLDLKELDGVLQPIIDSCTKDSISNGKGWIFAHATTYARSEVIILYILRKVTEPGATFETKLHLVYLINDVLHHCFRKNADDLKKILESAVVPIFCSTSIGVDVDKQQKLSKLHKLWETNKYFSQQILDQLQNPAASLAAYQAGLIAEYATLITPITTAIQTQYALLQKQHQDFVTHLTGQMHQMQSPANPMMPVQQAVAAPYMQPPPVAFDQSSLPAAQPQDHKLQETTDSGNPPTEEASVQQGEVQESEKKEAESRIEPEPIMHNDDRIPPEMRNNDVHPPGRYPEPPLTGGRMLDYPPEDMHEPPYGHPDHIPGRHPNGRPSIGPPHYMDDYSPHYGRPPPGYGAEPPEYGMDHPPPPPHAAYGPPRPFRDMPMGLGPQDMPPDYMEPAMPPPCAPPYYELPAGLMVPLVGLEDTDYNKPLDPEDVRLPPPALPTERLLAAVEQFYCPPTHERGRNNSYIISSDGWEQLGLYEFFKAKAAAKKAKGLSNEDKDYGTSMDLPSVQRPPSEPKVPRRRYREFKSPERESENTVKNGDRERRRSLSRSRSKSPDVPPRRSSKSPSPPRVGFQRSRGRSPPSKRRSPDRRSVSPPSFMGSGSNPHDRRLDESNKGHQLLKKMGWSGAGLGSNEQGIQDPVDAGDVRDRQDMYKGIGVNLNDPYENFRKSKGQAFINRMKARAEELGKI
ncbi:calcium homeostasis endoplasmic reticulum protein-like isoform X3 [Argiope bruennichi]|uniref:Calcium homeostasis endoplasmic reticulum like protein n=1 Tax=Argiope bruennichi TaxID=94029 RepID=A0A8T0FG31_ARGBR|nr:calcium homeostasis endoplasmic reticulum protein-like isoform X3 [Argiope bruennichi]KAF8788399.1 Calcium homeostasis endoplasmic reticulum like protein [Argiope bruennichi]